MSISFCPHRERSNGLLNGPGRLQLHFWRTRAPVGPPTDRPICPGASSTETPHQAASQQVRASFPCIETGFGTSNCPLLSSENARQYSSDNSCLDVPAAIVNRAGSPSMTSGRSTLIVLPAPAHRPPERGNSRRVRQIDRIQRVIETTRELQQSRAPGPSGCVFISR